MTEQLTLLIAIFSAIATALAAVATWRAPTAAAKLAESLRRDAERLDERQRQKLKIFTTLMQERARIYSEDAVRALNLIDVVFNQSLEVREAWAELLLALNMQPLLLHVVDERLRKLLGAVARDVGLGDDLRTDDFGRVYYPVIHGQEQFIKDMQRQQVLRSFSNSNPTGANVLASENKSWPPKPE